MRIIEKERLGGGRRSRGAAIATIAMTLVVGILATGCYVNQTDLWSSDMLRPDALTAREPNESVVPYGPAPDQHLNIYRPTGPAIGVIVWLHSGGWCCGDQINVDPLILDTVQQGYAVIGVDYRRSPEFHLEEIATDIDRAVRFVVSKRAEWGLATGKLLLGGGSAGGHLAALTVASRGYFVAPDLPADLRAVDPHIDGLISFVGPTDLRPYVDGTIASFGIDGPGLVESLLSCSNRGSIDPATSRPYARCTDAQVLRGSPLFWTALDRWFGTPLPPAYFAYSAADDLVPPSSQGEPIADHWQYCAGFLATWLDLPATAGHNISYGINRTAFLLWLRTFASP